ncbi:hypothetical protein LEP1GSC186_2972 [Leptospira noguchii serovar Autumnalis str. ZUN142]|uniref:Uncharacterized protein n=1 Tax=Leptospira noguchii serovar Autumnalis str. ZUN142 TaxID=1085540 RepID=M6U9H3_9LEPT|nr:hypothetical protein LEP1GSC186_2972 [Leptospira noguchii serovar Autumnalis str. ZUN142]
MGIQLEISRIKLLHRIVIELNNNLIEIFCKPSRKSYI